MKSGLRILIRAPEVPFSVPPKTPKMGVLAISGVPKMALQSVVGNFVVTVAVQKRLV